MDIEWLILADAAQVVGNKLYLMGGGWDRLTARKPFPFQQRMAVAASFRVPWNETNQKHHFEIEIIAEDEGSETVETVGKVGGEFEVGRPPGIRPGENQRLQIAVDIGLQLKKPGVYVIIGRVEGQELERVHFNVVVPPGVAPKQGS